MRLARYRLTSGETAVGILRDDSLLRLGLPPDMSLSMIFEEPNPEQIVDKYVELKDATLLAEAILLPPVDRQEVWAAGVTYKRSQTARMEESEVAASCYDRVYESSRPELFFKATFNRVSGYG